MQKLLILSLLLLLSFTSLAEVKVVDDVQQEVVLKTPAKRIVSLSPGVTELLYAAGGSEYVIGAVSYSDYPPAAKELPRVGRYNSLDVEKIVSLNPDLVVAWESGNPPLQISKLKEIGLNVYVSQPRNFDDIPKTMKRLGTLMNTGSVANNASKDFEIKLAALKVKYARDKTKPKSVYIQIWDAPLMTINGGHLISRIVEFCDGHNVFHDVTTNTLKLDIETVLEKNPDVIIASRDGELGNKWLSRWKEWKFMSAVKNNDLYGISADHLVRHTPRIINGIEDVCAVLQPEVR